jgi:hypothetical protein
MTRIKERTGDIVCFCRGNASLPQPLPNGVL